jgi:uncharacterized protein Veg
MNLSKPNQEKLERIKQVIQAKEGNEVTIEQALTRALTFYKQFVPYD